MTVILILAFTEPNLPISMFNQTPVISTSPKQIFMKRLICSFLSFTY